MKSFGFYGVFNVKFHHSWVIFRDLKCGTCVFRKPNYGSSSELLKLEFVI